MTAAALELPANALDPGSPATDQLVPGLLMFFARPSLLQTWAELFGHEWRHVGVTVQAEHGLRVASYGPRKCFRLDDPNEIMHNYSRVGVARLLDTQSEVEALQRFCDQFTDQKRSDGPYTFSCILMGPLHLFARRRQQGLLRAMLFLVIYLYCLAQQLRHGERNAFACSTFVWAAVAQARHEPLRIPLSAHPNDKAALATPSTARDELYARWLCGPTELWQSISEGCRYELDLDRWNQAEVASRLAT